MAFSNGTYTLVSGNPVVTGTTITSTWANNTLNDIAAALNTVGTSVSTGLVGAGTTQADATATSEVINVFSTVAANTGAKLSSLAALDGRIARMIIYNGGLNALKVYPAVGFSINNLPVNTGMTLPRNTTCMFLLVSSTQWIAILSA